MTKRHLLLVAVLAPATLFAGSAAVFLAPPANSTKKTVLPSNNTTEATYHSDGQFPKHSVATLLTCSKTEFDLGIVPKGSQADATFWLTNLGNEAVEISKIETSCDCFHVVLQSKSVAPNDKVKATIKLNLSHEPNFVGNLGLEATARTKSKDQPAFAIFVNVTVRDAGD